MALISTVAYSISINNKREDDKYLLNDLNGETFLELFEGFIGLNSDEYKDDDQLEKIFKIEYYRKHSYVEQGHTLFKYIIGKIKTGAYGQEAEIVNKSTGDVKYNKDIEDAEVMPFDFIVAVPTGKISKGLLILQKNGIFGVKTVFGNLLSDFFKDLNSDYKLKFSNIAPIAYFERLLTHGILKKIRFFRYSIPQDRANQVGIDNGLAETYDEYVINRPVGFIRSKRDTIMQCIRGQREISTIAGIDGFEYNNIKLEFKLGKTSKTINLSDLSSICFSEDITNQINLVGGHPTTESITPILIDTAVTYLEEMGLIARG